MATEEEKAAETLKQAALKSVEKAEYFVVCESSILPQMPHGSVEVAFKEGMVMTWCVPGETLLDSCAMLEIVNGGVLPSKPLFNCWDLCKLKGGGKEAFAPLFQGFIKLNCGKKGIEKIPCTFAVWMDLSSILGKFVWNNLKMGLTSIQGVNDNKVAWFSNASGDVKNAAQKHYLSCLYKKEGVDAIKKEMVEAGIVAQDDLNKKFKLREMFDVCARMEAAQGIGNAAHTSQVKLITVNNAHFVGSHLITSYLKNRRTCRLR